MDFVFWIHGGSRTLLEVRVKDCGVGGSIKIKMRIKLKRKIG